MSGSGKRLQPCPVFASDSELQSTDRDKSFPSQTSIHSDDEL
jgi:hypothetical protein